MFSRLTKQSYFIFGLILLCFFYIGFELFSNVYVIFSVDDFWFAHRIYQYKNGLPYRDFSPYKTVLGYYFLLFPLLFSQGIFKTLIFTKHFIALINASVLFISSCWLSRFFSRVSILISLSLLVISDIFLSYSTNIRVDLIGYWFGLFSLLFLLERRFVIAGVLLGIGFACTQKVIWYIFASDCALVICGIVGVILSEASVIPAPPVILSEAKDLLLMKRSFASLRMTKGIIQFNIAIAITIFIYLFFWSFISDWHTVLNNVFYEASIMYHLDWYDSARVHFWSFVTLYTPLLFLLWPFTLLSLFTTFQNDRAYSQRAIITIYSFVIFLCLIPYKQVFPYYMQVAYPIFLVLYASFFSWLQGIFTQNTKPILLIPNFFFWSLLIIGLAFFIWIFALFSLPDAYLIFALLPMLLFAYLQFHDIFNHDLRQLFLKLIVIIIIFMSALYPFFLTGIKLLTFNSAYQRATVNAVDALLKDGGDYLAGIELIYNKTQPIAGMRHLMGPFVDFLYQPTSKLRAVMLPSLYGDPTVTQHSVIEAIKKSSVKFYVNNYRMDVLPPKIKDFLASQYEHFWGSIYLYAPLISKGSHEITIKFSGNYLIETPTHGYIYLNQKKYEINKMIYLKKGKYFSTSTSAYRMKYIPVIASKYLNPRFQKDEWEKVIL